CGVAETTGCGRIACAPLAKMTRVPSPNINPMKASVSGRFEETAGDRGGSNSNQWLAMRLSLAVGIGMLVAKVCAYWLTGSAAILSDAAESIIHVIAVAFAAFSL